MRVLVLSCFVLSSVNLLDAQSGPQPTPLSATPARVVGHASVRTVISSQNPNLVEGREFWRPNAVAIDTSSTPHALYVSDSGNNRVLGWRDAASFANGAPADIVVGQRDLLSTYALGPGTTLSRGLSFPTGMAVDQEGNLYVVDAGNCRILRYPRPFENEMNRTNPDVLIGQADFDHKGENRSRGSSGVGNDGIAALPSLVDNHPAVQQLAFDNGGNLWFTDTNNHRVLRFPRGQDGKVQGVADKVLGQASMNTREAAPLSSQGLQDLSRLRFPVGVAIDSAGRIYVADGVRRVLVYSSNPLPAATSALRVLGLVRLQQGQQPPQQPNNIEFGVPMGLVMIGDRLGVVDQLWNRISIFDPFKQWPADSQTTSSPAARTVIGQASFSTFVPSAAINGLRSPAQAAFSGTEIFVADAYNNRVVVYPESAAGAAPGSAAATRVLGQRDFGFFAPNLIEGRELYLFNGTYTMSGVSGVTFIDSGGVAIDTNGETPHLYIADTYNNRVLGYRDVRKVRPGDTADIVIGQPDLFSSGINGESNDAAQPNDAGLYWPAEVAVDRNGNLWVADRGNGRVLRFNTPFQQPAGVRQRASVVLGQRNFTEVNRDVSQFNMSAPYGIAIMPDTGHVLVSDMSHHRVLMFRDPGGGGFVNGQAADAVFGQPNFNTSTTAQTGGEQMVSPRGIAVDENGRLYVADTGNNRILIYSQIDSVHGPGNSALAVSILNSTGTTRLRSPNDVAIAPVTGEIWVAEPFGGSSGRILRYPEYSRLLTMPSPAADFTLGTITPPAALAVDSIGRVAAAEVSHRVSFYFPPLWATNAANFLPNVAVPGSLNPQYPCCAPGSIAMLWPFSPTGVFGEFETLQATSLPLPKELGDITVVVSGENFPDTQAPLFMVSPSQINFQVPKGVPPGGTIDFAVMKKSTGEILATGSGVVRAASPAMFLNPAFPIPPGHGALSAGIQVVAQNWGNPQRVSCNGAPGISASPVACPDGVRPARRGETIVLYATGQGFVNGMPEDGVAASGQVAGDATLRVGFTNGSIVSPEFSGLAPDLVGVWQINVKVPDTAPPGPVGITLLYKDLPSAIDGKPLAVIMVE
ncbi:MAG: hypothetical protein ACM3S5_08310 [Rhodospirillales bacterium]